MPPYTKNPVDIEEFADSVIIFDDIDVTSDRKIREEIYKILNKVLEIGRHFKFWCLVTNYLPTNGKDTRRILNEAHQVVYCPHGASGRTKYLITQDRIKSKLGISDARTLVGAVYIRTIHKYTCWNMR